MIDGVLYVATSLNQLAAVDADNGTTLWVFDPKSYETPNPSKSRGLAYWREGARARLFLATGDAYLYSVDPMTGKTDPQFGSKGRVDLTLGLRRTVNRSSYAVTSPPVVCRDVVIVGSSIPDWDVVKNAPPGDVRGFDAHTGSLLWTFHTIPQAEEYGNETWSEKSWMYTGHTNVWSVMSVDEELGTVYLPVGTPTNDYFGGERPGANLFGDSLVCLKCLTGERIWHFQLVHHGLWDYDPPAAPNLVTLDLNGRTIPAVVQVTKQGLCFVFNRVTGEPIWPIEERPVPGSRLPGEHSWPTQPFPTRPPPFERQGIDADDLIDFTPELKQAALEILDRYHYGPLYTPPSETPTVSMPGQAGGASWTGAALDPETSVLFVPSVTTPFLIELQKNAAHAPYSYTIKQDAVLVMPGPEGLPPVKPPYSRVTAVDLLKGELLWVTPVGKGPTSHPRLRHLSLDRLGSGGRPLVLLTRELLFVAEGLSAENFIRGIRSQEFSNITANRPMLFAHNKQTGRQLWQTELPYFAGGSPMTYVLDGRQFIVIPIGGLDEPAELVALSFRQ